MPTLTEIELALTNGKLFALMHNGNYWRLRRNGRTKLWKTRPMDFHIPVKAGMNAYGQITQNTEIALSQTPGALFYIANN